MFTVSDYTKAKKIQGAKRSPPFVHGVYPELKYSQNYIRSPDLVMNLLNKTNICKNDIVLEIGPGKGAITKHLVNRCKQLIAIEKDPFLFQYLNKLFKKEGNLELVCDDFLNYNLPRRGGYKIFSNIPFYITAEVVRKLLYSSNPPEDSWLFMRREAASRYCGLPKENQISLVLKPKFRFNIVQHIARKNFIPRPRARVALLHIHKRKGPLIKDKDYKQYRDFIMYSFDQWKPTLGKSLRGIFSYRTFKYLSKRLNFKIDARPTELSFGQWLGVYHHFLANISRDKKVLVRNYQRKRLEYYF